MRKSGTLIERGKSYLSRKPYNAWRGVQEWKRTPNSAAAWAFFADFCGVFEVSDETDSLELARAEGRREAFFAMYDLGTMEGEDVFAIQERALTEGGE